MPPLGRDGRGGLLPAAPADRAGRAAARPERRPPGPAPGGVRVCRPGVELRRLSRRLGAGRLPRGDLVPALLRLRDARRAAGRKTPSEGRRPLGTVASGGLVAAAAAVLVANGLLACERGPHQPRDGGVRGLCCGRGLCRCDRISGARHRDGRALDGRGARSPGWARSHMASIYGTSRCSCSRAAPACCRRASCSGLVVLPVAIAFGAASWYFVERPIMLRAARLPRRGGGIGHCRTRRSEPPTAARSGRSRSRTPARSGSRPASSSGRAAAPQR